MFSSSLWKRLSVAACLCAAPAAADTWLRLTSTDFELYTAAGEKKGRATLEQFEQMRAFFLKASPLRKTSESPVRIIQFGSAKQFEPYSIRSSSPAFYLGTPARDYIIIGDPGVSPSVSAHEYMHLIIKRSGLRIPIWLNEGWADVYSTLRPMGRETAIGDLLAGRMHELNGKEWMDFETLTSITERSAEYTEGGRVGIFYAESWALAHMLYLAPDYQEHFGQFVMALHQGKGAAQAVQAAWGKSPDKVMTDVRAYFGRKQLFGRAFDLQLTKEQIEPSVVPATEFDSRLALAELLAVTNRKAEAKREYDALEKEQPGRADVARALGYLAGQAGDRAAVLKYFSAAFQGGESDPIMCLQLAVLERAAGRAPAEIIAILERALKQRPDLGDGQMQLGLTQIDARRFGDAIRTLMKLDTITPDRAPAVYCGLGYARAQLGDLAEAKSDAETCTEWAQSEREIQGAKALRGLITARSKPSSGVHQGEVLQQAQGTLTGLECSAADKLISVMTESGTIQLQLPEQAAVEFVPVRGGNLQLACGARTSLKVAIEYAPLRTGSTGADGILRRLEF